MRIVHYYARHLVHASGVTDAIENWVRLALAAGHDVSVLCAPVVSPREVAHDLRDVVRTVPHVGRGRTTWAPTDLGRQVATGDVVYLHEGWVPSNLVAARQVDRRGASVVVMPHGVYEPGITGDLRDVLGVRRAAERTVLRRAAWFHVFYRSEADLIDALEPGRRGATFVLPNGAPEVDEVPRWKGGGGYFLWMGRYDPEHKGIDNLLRRWNELPVPRPPLVLAGPDFRDGRRRTTDLVAELGLADVVQVQGNALGDEKDRLIRECRAYLHPSRWESCSVMLLEMLASGVPSLVSTTIHAAPTLGAAGVAHTQDFTTLDGFRRSLDDVDENHSLGSAARSWVGASGAWSRLGADYDRWLAGLAQEAAR